MNRIEVLILLALLSILPVRALTIAEVQFSSAPGPDGTWPSDREGETVSITGIVTATGYHDTRFFIQDTVGGWSGILIWDNSIQPDPGDQLAITGEVFEYNGHTEINPVSDYQLLAAGQPLPAVADLECGQVDSEEQWEGVLARLNDVSVTQAQDAYGQWWVDDGSGACEVDDVFFNLSGAGIDPQVGQNFTSITGIADYQHGNHAINPRFPEDLAADSTGFFLIARDTEIVLEQEATCWLECGELESSDEVSAYSIHFQLPVEVAALDEVVTEGSLSAGLYPQLTDLGGGEYSIILPEGPVLIGDLPLVGLSLEGLAPGIGQLDLLDGSLGGEAFGWMDDGSVYVVLPSESIGDTLTLIMRPLLNIPAIVTQGDVFEAWAEASPSSTDWSAAALRDGLRHELSVDSLHYDPDQQWWRLWLRTPTVGWMGMADLELSCNTVPCDTSWNAVQLLPELPDSYYFAQITDTHLPTHDYYDEPGALQDSSSMEDLRAVLADLAVINPAFVLLTGDVVNEGELEEFLHARYYTRTQRLLAECTVPLYVVSGNHDIGGWPETPLPAGAARYNWWRFFGWPRLDDPPAGAPARTQDYWFSYGDLHLVGMESYDNYDGFRQEIYGETSFTEDQLAWVEQAMTLAEPGQHKVLFYHFDFAQQLDLDALDVDLALWGHAHSNGGSLEGPPWALRTAQVTDHRCAFRLIRVTPQGLQPFATEYACAGDPLRVTWSGPNDGSLDSLTATVENDYPLEFPEAALHARLASGITEVAVVGGELLQLIQLPEYTLAELTFYVAAGSTQDVIVAAVDAGLQAPEVAISITSGLLTLVWNEVSGATYFRIEATDTYGESWIDISEDGTFEGNTWHTQLTGSHRWFRVIASN